MARNLGPKHRMCRRAGEKLCANDRCPVVRRSYGPGIHGPRMQRKMTEYGTQLLEKQKVRAIYGLMERQLRKYYDDAIRREGDTSEHLLQNIERRLDNVVYRCAIAKTRAAARQLITHGHMTVNGKRMTIPSYQVRIHDVVRVREASRSRVPFADFGKSAANVSVPEWLAVDAPAFEGRILRLPTPKDVPQQFRLRGIVEFYSR